jgi:hypothetical protein
MGKTSRPLWQLLLLTRDSNEDLRLTCEECFALLEYDADRLVAGANPAEIRPNVGRHLAICSSCRTQLDDWLEKLEDSLAQHQRK